MVPSRSLQRLILILAVTGCHTAMAGDPAPSPTLVVEAAFSQAVAGRWDRAVLAIDPEVVQGYRDVMLRVSAFAVAAKPTIYAQADSVSPSMAAFYGRFNATMAAGGPLLPLMGAHSLAELESLPGPRFIERLLTTMDSLATLHDSAHTSRAFRLVGKPVTADSMATVSYVLPGSPTRTVRLVRRGRAWRLAADGFLALLEIANR